MLTIRTVRIIGPSMEPTIRNGQVWLCWGRRVRPGRVIVFTEPDRPELIAVKRVIRRQSGGWWVEGDHPAMSRDSRSYGPIPASSVLGVLRMRLR